MNLNMNPIQSEVSPNLDFVVSHLRTQIVNIHNIIETIERTHRCESDYVIESFRNVENELRHLRRFIDK